MKIGIFDSGIGGLSVLHCAEKMLPDADYIYYADEKHVPYGERTPEEIKGFVGEILDDLISRGAEAIVIACNTATSIADKSYREKFPVPIIGMEPAVKRAVERYDHESKRIMVAATPVTIRGDKLKSLITEVDKEHEADLIAMPGLVRFAEQGIFESAETEEYIKRTLERFHLEDYGTIVLGCTHFNYFKRSFQKVFPEKVHFVDGNEGTVRQMIRRLKEQGKEEKDAEKKEHFVTFLFSGKEVTQKEQEKISRCMQQLDKMDSVI